jgi:hypothetical protein
VVSGDGAGVSGDVPGVSGAVPGVSGDVPGVSGDGTGAFGDVTGAFGDVTEGLVALWDSFVMVLYFFEIRNRNFVEWGNRFAWFPGLLTGGGCMGRFRA